MSAGVIAFTKALNREVVEPGILVTYVAPAPVNTDMIREHRPMTVELDTEI